MALSCSACFWLKKCPMYLDFRLIQSGCSFFHSSTFRYANSNKTHYDILGMDRKASQRDIRSAFLTLSKKHHPDINKNKDASKHFMEINEAYNILYNPAKRYHYDFHLHSQSQIKRTQSQTTSHSSAYEDVGNYYNISEEEWAKMYQASVPKRNHIPLIMVLIFVMITGSMVHSVRIQSAHKQFQEMADEETRKNMQAYNTVRERAANSTVTEQLERLSQLHRQNKKQ